VNVVAVTIAFIGSLTNDKSSPLGAVQLLWVNLIMDTMAALALATEPPTPDLLKRQPNSRAESLISRTMWRNIAVQAVFQLVICFVILYMGDKIWTSIQLNSTEHYTILFNVFVFMQVFNEINARELGNNMNVFRGLHKSYLFMAIIVITTLVQVIFVELGGMFTQCTPLSATKWFSTIGIGAFSLVIGVFQRLIPIKEPVYPKRLETLKDATGQRNTSILSPSDLENDPQNELLLNRPAFVRGPPSPLLGRGWRIARQTRTKIAVVNAFRSSGSLIN